ncbi:hypothetical protein, conserved [Leishmania tarentolae]|uniref:Uncharacterized protein n=1 Tax=Leishmania tarentolae TaxID=5689 RepID=A0A640KPU8_LEITA|nr:hypothetical protein, conserved [Leishmania tarentolae]
MLSETESLAFADEGNSPPLPRQSAKGSANMPKRPRINTMPRLHSPNPQTAKAACAKPPLHHPAPGSAAGGATAHPSHSSSPRKQVKTDLTSDSDTESILFAVEDGSGAGLPLRSFTSSMGLPAARLSLTSATSTGPTKRLSHVGSMASIHFNSEPGSRGTSPGPRTRPNPRASTPVEKVEALTLPLSSVRCCVPTDTSISFIEHDSESVEFGFSPLVQPEMEKGALQVKNSVPPLPLSPLTGVAAPPGTAGRHSAVNEDSIAFQTEDGSDLTRSMITSVFVQERNLGLMSSGSIPARRNGHSASVMESCLGDSIDNDSIAFVLEDDTNAEKPQLGATVAYPAKRDTGTPKVSYSPRSHSVHSRPSSRPLSPSIRFEIENTGNESGIERADTLVRGGGTEPPIIHNVPVGEHSSTPKSSSFPGTVPYSSDAVVGGTADISTVNTSGEVSTATTPLSKAVTQTKKSIVAHRLQKPQNHHSRLPQPRERAPTTVIGDAEVSPSRSATHPPLYQRAEVSTPLDAQAATLPSVSPTGSSKSRSASLSDRNVRRKRSALVPLSPSSTHEQQQERLKRRSKESAAFRTTFESPNHRRTTEEGSIRSTDSPPEALITGTRSHNSTTVASVAASSTQPIQMSLLAPASQGAPHRSTQGHWESQEVDHQYYQHHQELNRNWNSLMAHDHACVREGASKFVNGALKEAEQWRQFNERQRAELLELRKRIAIARRQDRTLLESSLPHDRETLMTAPSSHTLVPKPTAMGDGYSSIKLQSHWALHRPGVRVNDTKSGREHGKPAREVRATPQHTGSARRLQESVKCAYASAAAAKSSRHPAHGAGPAMPPPTPYPHPTSDTRGVSPDRIAQSAASASVADLLGILWPPRASAANASQRCSQAADTFVLGRRPADVDLYFLNGSRLTPEQVASFFDLVRVHTEAESRTASDTLPRGSAPRQAETLSLTNLRQEAALSSLTASVKRGDDAVYADPGEVHTFGHSIPRSLSLAGERCTGPFSAKLVALLPKKAIRRSRVMREVFDTMDLKRQRTIALDHLPSLARLFEVEIAHVEQTRESFLQGNTVPLKSLLESSVASRHLHATSWRGARDNVVLDYDGLTQDEQANLTHLTHRLLLLSFAVNVVIPIASASRIPLLDFPTLSLIVYAAVDDADDLMDSTKREWRRVVQQYFVALDA